MNSQLDSSCEEPSGAGDTTGAFLQYQSSKEGTQPTNLPSCPHLHCDQSRDRASTSLKAELPEGPGRVLLGARSPGFHRSPLHFAVRPWGCYCPSLCLSLSRVLVWFTLGWQCLPHLYCELPWPGRWWGGGEGSEASMAGPSRAPGTGFTWSDELMKQKPQEGGARKWPGKQGPRQIAASIQRGSPAPSWATGQGPGRLTAVLAKGT